MKISCNFLILDAQNCGLFANFALRLTDEAACRRVGKGEWRRKLACRWVGKGKREKSLLPTRRQGKTDAPRRLPTGRHEGKGSWTRLPTVGDHRQFKYPTKKGRVTVRGQQSEVLIQFLLNCIWKQAGWK